MIRGLATGSPWLFRPIGGIDVVADYCQLEIVRLEMFTREYIGMSTGLITVKGQK